MSTQFDQLLFQAQLAEQAERYDEMTGFVRQFATLGKELDVDARNLLSVAYKNSVGTRRASWRIIASLEHKQKGKGHEENAELAAHYRQVIEKDLENICDEILDLLDTHLLPKATTTESKVFFYKMKGDYYRYISEIRANSERDKSAEGAKKAYHEAMSLCKADLAPTHPIRLGLALNQSVFFYEILNKPDEACKMAQAAFDEAIAELDNVSEESYRDSTLIMQLIKDNLTLWTVDAAHEEAPKAE